jgi:hypothetical protein
VNGANGMDAPTLESLGNVAQEIVKLTKGICIP